MKNEGLTPEEKWSPLIGYITGLVIISLLVILHPMSEQRTLQEEYLLAFSWSLLWMATARTWQPVASWMSWIPRGITLVLLCLFVIVIGGPILILVFLEEDWPKLRQKIVELLKRGSG